MSNKSWIFGKLSLIETRRGFGWKFMDDLSTGTIIYALDRIEKEFNRLQKENKLLKHKLKREREISKCYNFYLATIKDSLKRAGKLHESERQAINFLEGKIQEIKKELEE